MLDERKAKRRDEFIAGLKDMADWYERHPDLETPMINTTAFVMAFSNEHAAALVRAAGGTHKRADDTVIMLERTFGGGLITRICLDKKYTCERRLVGTRVISAEPERTVPATPEREEPIYEWDCPESLLETLPMNDSESIATTPAKGV